MRAAAGSQVEGQEAETGERERERQHQHEVVLVHGRSVDGEVQAGDGRQRRGEAVHVVEQVERVRDPDEPEERDHDAEGVVRDELDPQACGDGDSRRGELHRELRNRAHVPDVVDEAGGEEQRGSGEDPRELPRRLEGAGEERDGRSGRHPGGDPDAAERRCRAVVPPLPGRVRDEAPAQGRRAEEGPEHEGCDGQRDDRDGCTHGR